MPPGCYAAANRGAQIRFAAAPLVRPSDPSRWVETHWMSKYLQSLRLFRTVCIVLPLEDRRVRWIVFNAARVITSAAQCRRRTRGVRPTSPTETPPFRPNPFLSGVSYTYFPSVFHAFAAQKDNFWRPVWSCLKFYARNLKGTDYYSPLQCPIYDNVVSKYDYPRI